MLMTNKPVAPLIRNAWYLAAWSHEIEEGPFGRLLLGEPVVLFRDASGSISALEDRCCHRGAPLTEGVVTPDGLQCGYHGMTFDRNGNCTVNPGEQSHGERLHVGSYPVVERQNFVWIWMGDPARANSDDIVDFPYHDQHDEWPFKFDMFEIDCNYMLLMDNLMDLTHLGYVHLKTIGGMPAVHVEATQETKKTDRGVHMMRWMLDAPPPPTFARAVPFKGNVDRWSDFEYIAPGTVLQRGGAMDVGRGAQENQDQEGAFRVHVYHGATPKSETSCYYFFSVGRGFGQDDETIGRQVFDEIMETFLEDKQIIEAQQKNLSREPDRPLLIRKHDGAVALARRAMEHLAKGDRKILTAAE